MVEPVKEKKNYLCYGDVEDMVSPSVSNVEMYNALAVISQQLDDIKHQHVEPPEPNPMEQPFAEWLNKEPKGLIDSMTQIRFEELVNYYYHKMNSELLTGKPGDNGEYYRSSKEEANDNLSVNTEEQCKKATMQEMLSRLEKLDKNSELISTVLDSLAKPIKLYSEDIEAVPNAQYIADQIINRVPDDSFGHYFSLGFDPRLRRTGYTEALKIACRTDSKYIVLVSNRAQARELVHNRHFENGTVTTLDEKSLEGLSGKVFLIDNSVDLSNAKVISRLTKLLENNNVVTFSNFK